MAYYTISDYALALKTLNRNIERGGPSGPHLEIYRASALVELGRSEEARLIVSDLGKSSTKLQADAWLKKWLSASDYEKTISNLYRVGLRNNINYHFNK